MSDTNDKKVKAFVIRDFRDDGTTQRFTAGTILDISEGAFVNYKAGGLVRTPTADDTRAAAKSDTK